MRYRKLGKTDFEVSDIGYGAWGIGGALWQGGTDDESLMALRRAIELGLNFIDTALAYGDGHSEKLMGNIVREASARSTWPLKSRPRTGCGRRGRVSDRGSLPLRLHHEVGGREPENLGVDHRPAAVPRVERQWMDRDEWRRAFEDLKRSGKVRAVGISLTEHDPDSALEIMRDRAHRRGAGDLQHLRPGPRRTPVAAVPRRNVGVLARVPLDEGGLTGKINASSTFPPGDFRNEYFAGEKKQQVAERAAAIIREVGPNFGSLPELALRFCISHPAVSTVIPGMRSVHNAEANCLLSDKGPLPPSVLDILKHPTAGTATSTTVDRAAVRARTRVRAIPLNSRPGRRACLLCGCRSKWTRFSRRVLFRDSEFEPHMAFDCLQELIARILLAFGQLRLKRPDPICLF